MRIYICVLSNVNPCRDAIGREVKDRRSGGKYRWGYGDRVLCIYGGVKRAGGTTSLWATFCVFVSQNAIALRYSSWCIHSSPIQAFTVILSNTLGARQFSRATLLLKIVSPHVKFFLSDWIEIFWVQFWTNPNPQQC